MSTAFINHLRRKQRKANLTSLYQRLANKEHIEQKNNLEKTISMNPKRKDPIFFESIDIGYINNKYIKMSVQGSPTHYSEPQKIVPLEQYENMEVGIIIDDHLADADELIELGLPEDLADKFRIGETTYGYASIEDIEAIYGNLEYIATIQGDAKFEELYGDKEIE